MPEVNVKSPNAITRGVSSLRFVDEISGLSAIYEESVNVVTLRLTPSSALLADAERAVDVLHAERFEVRPGAPSTAVSSLRSFPHLAADVLLWSEVLADLTGCEAVGVRLARLTEPMCPRFHVDRVVLRLVMTYHGPGTEFVGSEDVDRRHLGLPDVDGSHGRLVRTTACIRRAQTFDLVALKGEGSPDNEYGGAVHRSPGDTGGAARLAMTLDPLAD